MPLYEYICPKCAVTFERLRAVNQMDGTVYCPKCGNLSHRTLSVFATLNGGLGNEPPAVPAREGCGGCRPGGCGCAV